MANKVTIDVEARFIDNVTDEARAAAKSFDTLEKAAENTQKDLKELGKTKTKPKVDLDSNSAAKKLDAMDKKLNKFGKSRAEAKLSVLDKATAIIDKVTSKAKAFGGKVYSGLVKLRDSNVLSSLSKMSNGLKSLTSKAWTAIVKIKDTFTAPLTKLKNMLFNVKSLIAGIASAWAATQLVIKPINLADAYTSAQIGFSTLLGESGGQKMMNDLDEFAKVTPFKTSGVIANAQKMMAMGWDTETLIEDLEVIGNAAAATGKLDQGLESIVRALSQIKTKGRLSTEELNQLAEAGISAKSMLAENLGYGTGDEGIAKMTKDLESGAIASNVAIQALLQGMHKYDGMMQSMANETVEGLWSQIQDVFEINIFRKWGQGLQDGAKRGFGTVTELLEEAEEALSKFGDVLYEVGKTASNWVADKFQGVVDKILEITDSFEFQNADLKGKLSMLWNGVIVDPLKEWWEGGGREKTIETADKIGRWIGEMLTKGLLALFGATDILNENEGMEAGSSIAGSFLQGFLDTFDGKAITDAFVDAISNVWSALPWWAKSLLGIFGVGKAAGGIANLAGGITNLVSGAKNAIGSFNIASSAFPILTSSGTGIAGLLGKTGVALGASTTGGALLMGGAGIAGGLAGGASLIKGGLDLYGAYRANKKGDSVEARAKTLSGASTIGGVATGALIGAGIGSVIPGVGTVVGGLVGAGIGGIGGWIGGAYGADKIRETDDAINDVTAATEKLETEEEKLAAKAKLVWQNMRDHFGDIKLSTSEIARIADQIVWGDDMESFDKFTAATQTAEASLSSLKTAVDATERWLWKSGLGVKFNKDERESFKESFDSYISSARSYVENKHYEFAASVGLLVDVESTEGKSILASGDAFYGKLQTELDSLGAELSEKVEIALQDGVITLDEQEEIINLQNQIAEITQKISDAETEAELALIKVKFGQSNIDAESYNNLMAQMETTLQERLDANDTAFTTSVSSLNLQLAEGAITQEEYDKQLQTLTEGYEAKVDEIKARIEHVELEILGDAYSGDLDPHGTGLDMTEKLRTALENSLAQGIDPINWTVDQARAFLNTDSLSESSAAAIGECLSALATHMDMIDVDGNILVKVGDVETEPEFAENLKDAVDVLVEGGMDLEKAETIKFLLTAEAEVIEQLPINSLCEQFGLTERQSHNLIFDLQATTSISERLDILASDFGIPDTIAHNVLWTLTGNKTIPNPFKLTASDFGIKNAYSYSPTVNINPQVSTTSKNFKLTLIEGQGYRGGIFGGSFARGGMPDNSGIVGGSTRFIRVNEESPEMIIPLSDQRRGRALKLWAQAGNIMGVPGFARGGIVGGNGSDEGIRFNTYGGADSTSGRTVQVNVGGVKLEINVNGSDKESIVEAIKAQAGDLADYIAGVIAESLEAEFENTPVRGGVA